jgi:SAM-dependent methyltransferase
MTAGQHTVNPQGGESSPPVGDFRPWTARRAWLVALRLLPRALGRRILHVECDSGELVGALYHLGLAAEGIDVDRPAIARARTQWPCARFHRCRFDEFRPATAYDIIYCSTAGRCWPGQCDAAVDLIDRSLTPGGTLISDVEHIDAETVKTVESSLGAAGFEIPPGFTRSNDDPWRVFRRREPTRH